MVSDKQSTDPLFPAAKVNSTVSKNNGNRCEAVLLNKWYYAAPHVHVHRSTYLQTFTVITEGLSATDSY